MSILHQSHDLELVERMAEAGWNANPGRPAALTWACRESALMRKDAYELRQMMQAALRVVHAAYALEATAAKLQKHHKGARERFGPVK